MSAAVALRENITSLARGLLSTLAMALEAACRRSRAVRACAGLCQGPSGVDVNNQNVCTWVWVAVLAAIGCSDAGSPERVLHTSDVPLGAAAQEARRDAGILQPANVPPAIPGILPVPEPSIADPSWWCNGGKSIPNANGSGYACDCQGTGQAGEFCEGAEDDAGTAPLGERTLSFSSAWHSSCVITEDQHVRCWGQNAGGQLGDGTLTNRNVPTEVPQLRGVKQLDIGMRGVCAVLDDGRLRCWGADGPPSDDRGVTNVKQVSLGEGETMCVRHTDDTLECQAGRPGLLAGNGTQSVIDVEAGFFRVSVWLRDGTVVNWGNQLPTVPAQARIKRISSGYDHACVLADTGRVYCSGLSENEGGDSHVRGISGAIDIAAGFMHECALLRDRTLRCWGQNQHGQLGDGTNHDTTLPVAVVGESHVTQVECGRDHSCARHEDGSISCWGSNEYGQLGDGSWNNSMTPVRVLGF
jgi:alpha-tubulin suppressor-like RCC1 family protein